MRKAGLIGGMSWESTITYYRIINEKIREKLGESSSADMVIRSLDLRMIDEHQSRGEWNAVSEILCKAAVELEEMDVEFIVMASNTVHKVYDDVKGAVSVPVLHIAEPVVEAVCRASIDRIGLLGTRYTMQGDFLKERLDAAGIEVIVPSSEEMDQIHEAIFTEASLDDVRDETRAMFRDVIRTFQEQGARGVILGCTELGIMIRPEDSSLPLFDTAALHADKTADEIIGSDIIGKKTLRKTCGATNKSTAATMHKID